MAYQRKTSDEWQMWSNYGYGWDHELSEDSWREMREQLKCYRASCPNASFRAKKVRVKIEADNHGQSPDFIPVASQRNL